MDEVREYNFSGIVRFTVHTTEADINAVWEELRRSCETPLLGHNRTFQQLALSAGPQLASPEPPVRLPRRPGKPALSTRTSGPA